MTAEGTNGDDPTQPIENREGTDPARTRAHVVETDGDSQYAVSTDPDETFARAVYRRRLLGWSDERIGDELGVHESVIRETRRAHGIDGLVRIKLAERAEDMRLAESAAHLGVWQRMAAIANDPSTDERTAIAAFKVVTDAGAAAGDVATMLESAKTLRLPSPGRAGPSAIDIAEERRVILARAAAARAALDQRPEHDNGAMGPIPKAPVIRDLRSPYAPGTAPDKRLRKKADRTP